MKNKKIIAVILTVSLLISVISFSVSAITTVETQYNYEQADPSWLKDLIVMEELDINNAVEGKINLIKARSDYPYTETETSFKQNLQYYISLYTLDENSYMAAYLYVLQYLDMFSQATDTSISDDYIRYWLEENGIVYPAKVTPEDLIIARVLYSVLSTNDNSYSIKKGTSLESALTAYAAQMFGVDISVIQKYSSANIVSIQDYIIAACKYTLYLQGYNISKDTSAEETARLMAVYTIRSQGISVDENNITFEELKLKYLAAMLGMTYSVTVDESKLKNALNNNTVPSYMLQLIGKKYNLTLKETQSFSEMFTLLQTKTDYFNLEENEFYADIFKYDVQLKYKRDRVWILPTSIYTSDTAEKTQIYIDNTLVKDNYFNKTALDTSKKSQTVTITVIHTSKNDKKVSTYQVNIYQGTENPPEETNYISKILQESEKQIKSIISDLGTETTIADIFSNITFALPQRVLSIMSLLVPSFITDSDGYEYIKRLFGFADNDDQNVNTPVNTDKIGGVGGLEGYLSGLDTSVSIPFSTQLIQINTPTQPNVSFNGVVNYTLENVTSQNNYNFTDTETDVTSDNRLLGISVIVLAVAITVTGITLAVHFNKNGKSARQKPHGKNKKYKRKY